MKFCDNCHNMLYINIENKNQLKFYCKNCNFSTTVTDSHTTAQLINESNFDQDVSSYKHFMTPYIKYDPTLPRIKNIKCANTNCTNKDPEKQEVIYIKYDQTRMKYLYYCCNCEHFWKIE